MIFKQRAPPDLGNAISFQFDSILIYFSLICFRHFVLPLRCGRVDGTLVWKVPAISGRSRWQSVVVFVWLSQNAHAKTCPSKPPNRRLTGHRPILFLHTWLQVRQTQTAPQLLDQPKPCIGPVDSKSIIENANTISLCRCGTEEDDMW